MANRIFYGCLGIANCDGTPIQGVQSVGLSVSRSVNTLFSPGKKDSSGQYSNLPDIEVSYTKYIDSINSFDSEAGLSGYTGLTILAGEDTVKCLGGAGVTSTIGFKELLLSSITYSMSIDGPFTVQRTYKGWSSGSCTISGLGVFANCNSVISGSVKRRGCFTATQVPSAIGSNTIQSVSVSMQINRDFVNQFASRKPYASYVNFPVETSCTFDVISKSLSSVNFPTPVKCGNAASEEESITLSVGGAGSLNITKAFLSALNYSGAEAKSGGSNLKLSATYTSYVTPATIKPFVIL